MSSELKIAEKRTVQIGLSSILVCNVGGKYFAMDNLCSHLKVPLALGSLDGDVITCLAHGARFDVKTGKMLDGPANEKWRNKSMVNKVAGAVIPKLFARDVLTYPVSERAGKLFIQMPD